MVGQGALRRLDGWNMKAPRKGNWSRGIAWSLLLLLASAACTRQTRESPGKLIDEGWDNFSLGEYAFAIAKFQKARDLTAAGTETRAQALFGLASTLAHRTPAPEMDQAEKIFNEIAREDPDRDLAAWSLLSIGRLKQIAPVGTEPDYRGALECCRQAADKFPFHPAGEEAFLHQIHISLMLAGRDRNKLRGLVRDLESFMANHPRSPFRSSLYALGARCLGQLEDHPGALAWLVKSFATAERSTAGPVADQSGVYWKLAAMAEFKCGDLDTARKYYHLILKEYPSDQKKFGVLRALERLDQEETRIRTELAAVRPAAKEARR